MRFLEKREPIEEKETGLIRKKKDALNAEKGFLMLGHFFSSGKRSLP